MPALVASLVAQDTDDAENKTTDFLVTSQPGSSGVDVLAMTCATEVIAGHIKEFKASGFAIQTITYAGLGAVELLGQVAHKKLPVAIAITFTNQTTKIAVLHHGRPLLFRTLQQGLASTPTFANALASELQRTLAFIGASEHDSAHVYLIGEKAELGDVASVLAEALSSSVSITGVLDQVDDSQAGKMIDPASYANLIGVGSAFLSGNLDLNFVRPREVVKPPGPWRRVAFWSSIAVGVLAVLGYMVYRERGEQLDAIESKRTALKRFSKRANKSQELQDIVDAVEQWQSSDIAWLDELRDLSERFPTRAESLVKRMSMSAGPDGAGVITLSVQVQSPEIVTEMESAIRDNRHSVSSKRVTEVSDRENLNWSFDTKIVFRPLPRPEFQLDAKDDTAPAKTRFDQSESEQSEAGK